MSQLADDLLDLVTDWLPADDDPDRPVIQLATRHDDHGPDIRSVLLSEWNDQGFYFHTDTRNRKCAQLAEDPSAAFTIAWPDLRRQLTVRGTAEPADAEECARAFAARSDALKVLAHLNTPEFAQLPDDVRIAEWARFIADHDLDALEPPATWTGFLIRPSRVTAWQGSLVTASRRIEWTALGGSWSRAILPG